jgi:hypothetical protein
MLRQPRERDKLRHRLLQRRRIKDARRAHRQPSELAEIRQAATQPPQRTQPTEHLRITHLTPDPLAFGNDLLGAEMRRRGDERGIERTDTRPNDQAGPLTALLQDRQKRRQHPELIGAPSATAGQNDRGCRILRHRARLERPHPLGNRAR